MKLSLRHFLYVVFTVGALFLTRSARAETELVSARFTSQVQLDVLRETACGLQPTLTLDERAHPIDVRVGPQRCASTPLGEASIPLVVRIEPGEPRYVVLEADVPDGISADALRGPIAEIANTLQTRVVHAMAAPPITVVQDSVAVPSVPDVASRVVDVRAFAAKNDWHRSRRADGERIAGLVVGGVLGLALLAGLAFLAASTFQGFHGFGFGY